MDEEADFASKETEVKIPTDEKEKKEFLIKLQSKNPKFRFLYNINAYIYKSSPRVYMNRPNLVDFLKHTFGKDHNGMTLM